MQRILALKIYPSEYDRWKVIINEDTLNIHIDKSMYHLGYWHYHD